MSHDPGIYRRSLDELFRLRAEREATGGFAGAAGATGAAGAGAGAASKKGKGKGKGCNGQQLDAGAAAKVDEQARGDAAVAPLGAIPAPFQCAVHVSIVEIYNEVIYDLLDASDATRPEDVIISTSDGHGGSSVEQQQGGGGDGGRKLDIRLDAAGQPRVPGATVLAVANQSQVEAAMSAASARRATFQTNANERSSRSHCLVMLDVVCSGASAAHANAARGAGGASGASGAGTAPTTKGRLVLVDLAGSERVSKTAASGARLKEAQHINKSLSALGDVMGALAAKRDHVPFRNSKLTHLLQPSLGRDNKALMIAQVNPDPACHQESGCTMQFASRVRHVELGPAKRNAIAAQVARQAAVGNDDLPFSQSQRFSCSSQV